MGARNVQQNIEIDNMFRLLEKIGADPYYESDGIIRCTTICHGGSSDKLYYYDNYKAFTCYTSSCGRGFSIYDLLILVRGYSFAEAYRFVCDYFGIKGDYEEHMYDADFSFLDVYEKEQEVEKSQKLKVYQRKDLAPFIKTGHISWVKDNISLKTMREFDIRFNIEKNQIVIPHYHHNGDLIGIRVRNLDEQYVKSAKYMPLIHNQHIYSHPTSLSIYGLYKTIENINSCNKIILFESEKSVLQLHSYDFLNIGGAISGNSLSKEQIDILLDDCEIDEIIIGMDKEYEEFGTKEEFFYQQKIKSEFIDRLSPYANLSVLWDKDGLLDKKDSPTDKGEEVFLELFENRWII